MASFSVMLPPIAVGREAEAMERAVFLKDGFNLYAFLFTGIWLLAKRLWLAFLIFAVLWLCLILGGRLVGINPLAIVLAQALIGVFLGLEGGRLLERKLTRQGWSLAGVVEGRKLEEAERRFFERAHPVEPARMGASSAAAAPALPAGLTGPSVVGLFPDPRGR